MDEKCSATLLGMSGESTTIFDELVNGNMAYFETAGRGSLIYARWQGLQRLSWKSKQTSRRSATTQMSGFAPSTVNPLTSVRTEADPPNPRSSVPGPCRGRDDLRVVRACGRSAGGRQVRQDLVAIDRGRRSALERPAILAYDSPSLRLPDEDGTLQVGLHVLRLRVRSGRGRSEPRNPSEYPL